MMVRYRTFEDFCDAENAADFLKSAIDKYDCKRILEVGSGATPTLELEFVRVKSLDYVTSDVSEEELAKAGSEYGRLVLDLSVKVNPALHGSFDCACSRYVAEHIRDGAQYHGNIFNLLRPGGIAVHWMPCLGSLPFFLNRMLPDSLTEGLRNVFALPHQVRYKKFKAYYSWTSGPSKTMIERFHSLGFEIIEYVGCFGHPYYKRRMPLLQHLEVFKSRQLLRRPIPQLCSYAAVILRKPRSSCSKHIGQ